MKALSIVVFVVGVIVFSTVVLAKRGSIGIYAVGCSGVSRWGRGCTGCLSATASKGDCDDWR